MGCICNKTHNEDDDHGVDYVALGQYIGEKNCCGQRHGKGQYYYDNGDSYDGTWKRNMKHGYGTYTYADGRRVIGFFYNDEFYGDDPPPGFKRPESVADEDATPLPPSGMTHAEEEEARTRRERREEQRKERQHRKEEHEKKMEEMRKKYGIKSQSLSSVPTGRN